MNHAGEDIRSNRPGPVLIDRPPLLISDLLAAFLTVPTPSLRAVAESSGAPVPVDPRWAGRDRGRALKGLVVNDGTAPRDRLDRHTARIASPHIPIPSSDSTR